jgi:hypothetical protein
MTPLRDSFEMPTHETARIVIGQSTSDHVTIERVSPPNNEGWFHASVSVQSAVWSGKLRAEFTAGELRRFGLEIERLYEELKGRAVLRPMESFLEMIFEGDGRGHIVVNGAACDRLGSGTRLEFEFELDQTQLPSIARALLQADPEVR